MVLSKEVTQKEKLVGRFVAATLLCIKQLQTFFFLYLPYLSSIHETANHIAILWTGSPHLLGSCRFRGLWATCLPHKGGVSR